jgi:GT2 family glycosyltransferase
MIDLSIVIVSYNVKLYLEQALRSIDKALDNIRSEVFVVDNGSGDGSADLVRKKFPKVRLICNQENVGFAKANNQVLKLARGNAVCLINPDTLVREDTFHSCLNYLKRHPDVGVVGCKILNPDGTLQLPCRRSFPTPWVALTKVIGLSSLFPKSRLFGRYNLTFLDPDETSEVEAISGSFMMVRKETIDQVGLLDERFFLYGEDLDWCYRIWQGKWKIVYFPETQIIHYKGRSAEEAPFDNLKTFYHAMRLFVQKHFRKGWVFLPKWFLILGIWLRGGLSFLFRLLRRLAVPAVDVFFIQAALVLAIYIRFGEFSYWPRYRVVNIIYTLVWIGCLALMGLYRKGIFSSSKAIGGAVLGLILNTSFTFFYPQYAFSRRVILVMGGLIVFFLAVWRLAIRLFSRSKHVPFLGTVGKTLARRRTLIVGSGKTGQDILKRLRSRIDTGYEVVGFLGLNEKDLLTSTNGKVPVLGTLKDLERIAIVHKIQSVIFSHAASSYEQMLSAVARGKELHLDFRMVPGDIDVIIGRSSIDTIEDIPLVDLDYKLFSVPNQLLKRSVDVIVSLFVVILFFPVRLVLRLHPSFQFQKAMVADGHGGSFPVHELEKKGEKVSGWLGSVSLWTKVFQGKLSIVGSEMEYHSGLNSGYGFKPGLTGLVQLNLSKHLTEKEKERYRIYYLRNYSILLDLEIMIRSLFG